MVTPGQRRAVVTEMRAVHALAVQQSCRYLGVHRALVSYRPQRDPQHALRAQLRTLALAKPRWGVLQYVTSSGRMSLSPDPSYTPPASPAPTVLDERAAVGNLSRNIVIQGADDSAWENSGFGAHVMIMELRSKVVIDGVELRRVGQSGVTARYPIHWHMLSYGPTGALLGATSHRMPILLDGPVGIAAALVARDLGSQIRHWCLLPDAGTFALVRQGADVLGLTPVTELGLDLGEGLNALAALPLLRTAIDLAGALPVHPALLAGHDDE